MLPEPGTAHVFLASPGALLAAARSHPSWLSEGERARAARTRAPEGRDGYLATRVLVRGVLARTLGRSPRELTFVENAHGRPSLEPPAEGVDFNASRSPAWVALVLTRGTACGIDVEDLQRRAGVDTVARAFAPEERALLDRAPASERRRVFFELWTLKEAFLKARGTGIAGGTCRCVGRYAGACKRAAGNGDAGSRNSHGTGMAGALRAGRDRSAGKQRDVGRVDRHGAGIAG